MRNPSIPTTRMTKKKTFLYQPADDRGATYWKKKTTKTTRTTSPLTHQNPRENMRCLSRRRTLTHITSLVLCPAARKAKHQPREKGLPQQLTFGPGLGSVPRAAHRPLPLHQQRRENPPQLVPEEAKQPGEPREEEEEEHEGKEDTLQAATRTLTSAD